MLSLIHIYQPVEIGLRRDLESQQIKEGHIVLLKDAEQVVDLAAPVVDELCLRT